MRVFLNKLYHVFIEGRKPGTWCSKKIQVSVLHLNNRFLQHRDIYL